VGAEGGGGFFLWEGVGLLGIFFAVFFLDLGSPGFVGSVFGELILTEIIFFFACTSGGSTFNIPAAGLFCSRLPDQ
jgi:hypothetical protein